MPAPYTIYCTRGAETVTPQDVQAALAQSDLSSLAEGEGISEALAEAAVELLSVESTDAEGFNRYRVTYHPSAPALDVARWAADDQTIAALTADLRDGRHPSAGQITSHLGTTVDVIELCHGYSPNESMATVLADLLARWFAWHFGGLVRTSTDAWWCLDDTVHFAPLATDDLPPAGSSTADLAAKTLRYALPDAEQPSVVRNGPPSPTQSPPVRRRRGFRVKVPAHCPSCGASLRPASGAPQSDPSLTWTGRALMAVAVLTATVVFIGGRFLIRAYVFVPSVVLGCALLPVALVPGIGIGLLAHRLPKVLKLRCRHCAWRGGFDWD